MRLADLTDEGLDIPLRVGVEAGRRFVQQQQDRRGQEPASDCDFLLHAARHVFHRVVERVLLQSETHHDLAHLGASRRRLEPVQASGVHQVLDRRELLEERRIDRYAVDQSLDGKRVVLDIVSEDTQAPAVREQQRRDEPDQRRLAGSVRAENTEHLAARDREIDLVQGDDFFFLDLAKQLAALPGSILADEHLAHAFDFECRGTHEDSLVLLYRDHGLNRPIVDSFDGTSRVPWATTRDSSSCLAEPAVLRGSCVPNGGPRGP